MVIFISHMILKAFYLLYSGFLCLKLLWLLTQRRSIVRQWLFFFSFKNTWLLFYKAKRYTLTWVKRSIHAWNMQPEKRYWAQNVFLLQLLFCSFCAPRGTCFCVHQKHRETSLILNSGAFCHLCFFSLCYIWSLFNVDCISHKFLCQIRSAKLNFMAAKKCKTDMWYR